MKHTFVIKIKKFIGKYGFNLTEIVSNSIDIVQYFDDVRSAEYQQEERALGVAWNATRDEFSFTLSSKYCRVPRWKIVLTVVASIFDPLGLISLLMHQGKRIFQISLKNYKFWATPISAELHESRKERISAVQAIVKYHVPHCLKYCDDTFRSDFQIFCDGCEIANDAVAYLRCVGVSYVGLEIYCCRVPNYHP